MSENRELILKSKLRPSSDLRNSVKIRSNSTQMIRGKNEFLKKGISSSTVNLVGISSVLNQVAINSNIDL